jgi:hypothetical protein
MMPGISKRTGVPTKAKKYTVSISIVNNIGMALKVIPFFKKKEK